MTIPPLAFLGCVLLMFVFGAVANMLFLAWSGRVWRRGEVRMPCPICRRPHPNDLPPPRLPWGPP